MAMNLGAMSAYICNELGLYDATSIALCNSFIDKEYRILWDKFNWSDANDLLSFPAPAGASYVNYPAGMDRIITLRATNGTSGSPPPVDQAIIGPPAAPAPLDSRFLDSVNADFLIEAEPSIFEGVGYTKYYQETGTQTQRQIRLFPAPASGMTLLVFGKAICPGLINNSDTSLIRNLDEVIIAYAYFDMLQRQRQYAKAQQKRQEAQELEANAVKLETEIANKPRRSKTTTVAGNSLSEMTDAVCTICGQWTPEYRLIIKDFLRHNYTVLYDLFLWAESVLAVRVPYTGEQVVMPHYVDKVIGIRGDNNSGSAGEVNSAGSWPFRLFPADGVLFLDIQPQIFEQIGNPIGYVMLTPVAVATLPPTTTPLVIASTSPLDKGSVFIRGEVISGGVVLREEVILNGTTPVATVNSYDIPITVAKDITYGDVTVNAITSDLTNPSLVVIPADRRELKHQRVWLLPIPNADLLTPDNPTFELLVLAKRAIHPLQTDQDTPIITGAQQVLIHAAAADLFRKLKDNDSATAMQTKADGATKSLIAKNTDQAASSPRFVPDIEPRAFWPGLQLVHQKW